MANIIQGGDLMLFLKKGSGSTASKVSVAFATNHSISISTETTDTTHKDIKGGWTSSAVKTLSWEVSTENLYSNDGEGITFGDLYDLMVSKTEIDGVFGVNASTAQTVTTGGWVAPTSGEYFSGKVIITSLEVNAPAGDNATFTCQFNGVGALTHHK